MRQWCGNCAKNVATDNADGKVCCVSCGKVIAEDNYTEEAQFVKTANGQARMAGNFVRSVQSFSESTERTLNEASYGIENMMLALGIDGGQEIVNGALKLYRLILEKNRTRGRRKDQVQAACLYIFCRMKNKPYLLIDFSEHLRINVYVLGAVFLQLCKILSLEETQLFQKLVDPSLFIHRFSDRLFKGRNQNVSRTALQIIASMKRDWMQTGRKPSGLCGAALYISALAHGFNLSKSEIIKAVHICEATLTKRLIEFENTESGGLTIEEFEKKSEEFDSLADKFDKDESQMKSLHAGKEASRSGELLCRHKGSGIPHFAYGLCKDCYKDFKILSGGLSGGSEPPAFQRAERKRIMALEAAADSSGNLDSSMCPGPNETNSKLLNSDEQRTIKKTIQNDVIQPAHPESTGATLQSNTTHHTINDKMDDSNFTLEESENLSDIDDIEVDVYINTEEEKNLKTTVWEEINREYLEEQAEKQAAALAAKKAYADSEGAAQNRKEKRQKRAAERKNLGPPSTSGEAIKQMLDTKGLSSRLPYDSLKKHINLDELSSPGRSKTKAEAEQQPEGSDDYWEDNEEDPELDYTGDAYANYTDEYDYDQDNNDMDDY